MGELLPPSSAQFAPVLGGTGSPRPMHPIVGVGDRTGMQVGQMNPRGIFSNGPILASYDFIGGVSASLKHILQRRERSQVLIL